MVSVVLNTFFPPPPPLLLILHSPFRLPLLPLLLPPFPFLPLGSLPPPPLLCFPTPSFFSSDGMDFNSGTPQTVTFPAGIVGSTRCIGIEIIDDVTLTQCHQHPLLPHTHTNTPKSQARWPGSFDG